MTLFTFCCLKLWAALRARFPVSSSNRVIVSRPTPFSTELWTLGLVTVARVRVNSFASLPRFTATFTVVPTSPRILSAVSLAVQALADSSLTAVITSPASIPAFSAGLPASTRSTVGLPLRVPISAPTPPPILPDKSSLNAADSLASINTVYWSPAAATSPRLAPSISFCSSRVPS